MALEEVPESEPKEASHPSLQSVLSSSVLSAGLSTEPEGGAFVGAGSSASGRLLSFFQGLLRLVCFLQVANPLPEIIHTEQHEQAMAALFDALQFGRLSPMIYDSGLAPKLKRQCERIKNHAPDPVEIPNFPSAQTLITGAKTKTEAHQTLTTPYVRVCVPNPRNPKANRPVRSPKLPPKHGIQHTTL